MLTSDIVGPYVLTNLVSLFLVIGAILSPKLVRWIFILMFLGAAIVNTIFALRSPELYQRYADAALIGFYRDFIGGFFRGHTAAIVLPIAFGQLCIAFLLSRRDPLLRAGIIGASIFLLAIVPLGMGSAIPAPLLMIVALGVMYRRLRLDEPGTGPA